jgi:hypothetical protein
MRLLTVVVVALAGLTLAPTGAGAQEEGSDGQTSPDPGFDELGAEGQMEAALAANPGSIQLSDDEILLEPGVVLTLPRDGDVTTQGVPNCPYEWFCLYEHSDYNGWLIRFYTCNVLYNLTDYSFYNETEQAWDDWAFDASSWHNNQSGGAQAWIYKWSATPAGGELYRAGVGAVPYVGDYWNDTFWELFAC